MGFPALSGLAGASLSPSASAAETETVRSGRGATRAGESGGGAQRSLAGPPNCSELLWPSACTQLGSLEAEGPRAVRLVGVCLTRFGHPELCGLLRRNPPRTLCSSRPPLDAALPARAGRGEDSAPRPARRRPRWGGLLQLCPSARRSPAPPRRRPSRPTCLPGYGTWLCAA